MTAQPGLSSEERIRRAVRAAKMEMEPAYVEILRNSRPGVRIQQSFSLWRMARDALYRQGIERGMSPEDAMRSAAQRLLETRNLV